MAGLLELPLEIRLQIREYLYTNNTFHIARCRNARSTRLPQPRYYMLSTRCNFEAEGAAGDEAAHNCSHPQQITWSRGLWFPLHVNRQLRREIESIFDQTLKVVFFGSLDIVFFQDSLEKHSVSLYARVRRVRKHIEAVYSNGRERAFSRLEAAVGGLESLERLEIELPIAKRTMAAQIRGLAKVCSKIQRGIQLHAIFNRDRVKTVTLDLDTFDQRYPNDKKRRPNLDFIAEAELI